MSKSWLLTTEGKIQVFSNTDVPHFQKKETIPGTSLLTCQTGKQKLDCNTQYG